MKAGRHPPSDDATAGRRRTPASRWLRVAAAVVLAALPAAGQDRTPVPTAAFPYHFGPGAEMWGAALNEVLAGNVQQALAAYREIAERYAPGPEAHRALLRVAEIDYVTGDRDGFLDAMRKLQKLTGQDGPIEPGSPLDDADAGHRQQQLHDLGRQLWRLGIPVSGRREPPPGTPPPAAPVPSHPRLSVPVDPTGLGIVLRRRATEITELRLAGRTAVADRLQEDLVQRLRESGRGDYLRDTEPPGSSPSSPHRILTRAREILDGSSHAGLLTPAETDCLQRVRDRLAAVAAADGPAAAVVFLDSLPYRLRDR